MPDITVYDAETEMPFSNAYNREQITKALHALSEGRNMDCFPVVGFGGKDADLDPSGCTGIERVNFCDDVGVEVKVGGHKTVVPFDSPEYTNTQLEEMNDTLQEIVIGCEFQGDWTGDDWSMWCEYNVYVNWATDIAGEVDYVATAHRIIALAKKRLQHFWSAMNAIEQAAERIDKSVTPVRSLRGKE